MTHAAEASQAETKPSSVGSTGWMQSDDIWAMLIAAVLLVAAWWANVPVAADATGEPEAAVSTENLLTPWLTKPGGWKTNPLDAFRGETAEGGPSRALAVAATAAGCVVVFAIALAGVGVPLSRSVPALITVTLLAVVAWLVSTQAMIKSLQLEYVLWAFAGGLFVSNVIGVPAWLRPALRG